MKIEDKKQEQQQQEPKNDKTCKRNIKKWNKWKWQNKSCLITI